jgi:hypothetical protein
MGGEPITPKSTIIAQGQPMQVLGVTPPSFFGMVVGDRFRCCLSCLHASQCPDCNARIVAAKHGIWVRPSVRRFRRIFVVHHDSDRVRLVIFDISFHCYFPPQNHWFIPQPELFSSVDV